MGGDDDAPPPTILDGGMGHELKARGVSDGTFLAGVLANVEGSPKKHIVEDVHRDYLAAGCDVITTNSFVAVPRRMMECGQASDNAESANRRAAELQTREKQRPLPPIWISFTIHDNQHQTLRSGEMLEMACRLVVREASNLDVPLKSIGVNCSTPSAISGAVPMIANIAQEAGIGVSAYGNCFRTTTSEWMDSLEGEAGNDKEGACAVAEQSSSRAEDYDGEGYLLPEAYARFARQWVASGVTIVGGCCGSRPGHMEAVARTLRRPKVV